MSPEPEVWVSLADMVQIYIIQLFNYTRVKWKGSGNIPDSTYNKQRNDVRSDYHTSIIYNQVGVRCH